MPKLWTDTIEEHRRQVRSAVVSATEALVEEKGLLSVTMSAIAGRAGIGRATLYKYFPDVEAILLAWHDQQVGAHLQHLQRVATRPGSPSDRVRAMLDFYAQMVHSTHGHHDGELTATLHRGRHLTGAQESLLELIGDLLQQAAAAGQIRDDTPPAELACYCLHALEAAAFVDSRAAVARLVDLTYAGLGPLGLASRPDR